jgi:hypothetical protein
MVCGLMPLLFGGGLLASELGTLLLLANPNHEFGEFLVHEKFLKAAEMSA